MKIAVYLPNWIGDAVMATPALSALRSRFSNSEIVAISRPHVSDVISGLGLADRTLIHSPRGKDRTLRGRTFLKRLKAEKFDTAVLFPELASIRLARLAFGRGERIGFARDGRGFLLTEKLSPLSRRRPNPVLDEYLRIVERLGCDVGNRQTRAAVLPEDQRQLDLFWGQFDPAWRRAGVICLNPGGAFGASKHWPTECFADIARRIVSHLGKTVLVLCGPAERHEARAIVKQAARTQVVSLADTPTSIGLTKAAIREAELLVTTDSGPRHFAQPFGVPVITIFGPTHQAWSETNYEKSVHLQIGVPCGPCQQKKCPLKHHRCMQDLPINWVYDAVLSEIHKRKRAAA